MSGIGTTGIILIILVALLLFGPNKLPELGRAFGRTLKEFKNGAKDIMPDDDQPKRKEVYQEDTQSRASMSEDSDRTRDTKRLPD
ncbi:Sec-independent protein translocase protein TatAd [Chlamydia abortus]|uniref:Sec-independent protein translocase protein TatA n=1 Tax=Paenibacillus residui TaxID=629724 RepID=A0ABW3D7Y1_9BACL|nr:MULTISPECIES: twin-arginine translocase TatA/TatE family subunit [Paenibacillaceae]SHE13511.1 Sec-independent protein translocase protein TatAd [Chlamydia abortus]